MANVLRCRTTFWHGDRLIKTGDIVAVNDPAAKAAPAHFETPEAHVEQATAAPGERRTRAKRD